MKNKTLLSLFGMLAIFSTALAADRTMYNPDSNGDLLFSVNRGGTPTTAFKVDGVSTIISPNGSSPLYIGSEISAVPNYAFQGGLTPRVMMLSNDTSRRNFDFLNLGTTGPQIRQGMTGSATVNSLGFPATNAVLGSNLYFGGDTVNTEIARGGGMTFAATNTWSNTGHGTYLSLGLQPTTGNTGVQATDAAVFRFDAVDGSNNGSMGGRMRVLSSESSGTAGAFLGFSSASSAAYFATLTDRWTLGVDSGASGQALKFRPGGTGTASALEIGTNGGTTIGAASAGGVHLIRSASVTGLLVDNTAAAAADTYMSFQNSGTTRGFVGSDVNNAVSILNNSASQVMKVTQGGTLTAGVIGTVTSSGAVVNSGVQTTILTLNATVASHLISLVCTSNANAANVTISQYASVNGVNSGQVNLAQLSTVNLGSGCSGTLAFTSGVNLGYTQSTGAACTCSANALRLI